MKGVTSKGIFSRSAIVPMGLLLIISSLSFHGSIFTRPPIGKAAIFCALCLGSVGAAAVAWRFGICGTRLPRCALIRLGISFWRDCNACRKRAAFDICQAFASCGFLRAL